MEVYFFIYCRKSIYCTAKNNIEIYYKFNTWWNYYSYNQYVSDNMSHAYFSSGNSFYEIFWVGNQITPDIEKLIKDTPDSEIGSDSFNSIVDNAIDTYIKDRDDQLSYDSLYNDYEARSSSKSGYGKTNYDRLREGYITFYNNRYH